MAGMRGRVWLEMLAFFLKAPQTLRRLSREKDDGGHFFEKRSVFQSRMRFLSGGKVALKNMCY